MDPSNPKNRTTSAGYRFPLASRPRSSDFHQQCVPANQRQQAAAAAEAKATKGGSEGEFSQCDVVTQDKIWTQMVDNEKSGVKTWENNWGFLTEFDPKGRPKTAKELPDKVNMFSQDVANTNSGNYGGRLNTDLGQTMQRLDFQFNSGNRKKKLGSDLVCY